MPWPDIVGHAPVVAQLQRAVRDGTVAHATLLTGPDEVGKTTLAEALAADLLDADGWPGGLAAHPDHWLEDSPAERIGIDRLRSGGGTAETGPSLQDIFALRPYAGGRRVAVIGRADRLTEQAANSVLKVLEEPPPLSHIILCAAHPERLPATVVSRCRVLACAPLPAAEIEIWLRRSRGVEAPLARIAAVLASGRPGRALELATTPGAMDADLDAVDAFLTIAGSDRRAVLQAAERLAPPASAEGRERALAQLAAWTGFVRDVACLIGGAPELTVWEAYAEAAGQWAEVLPAERVARILGRCVTTADQLAQYALPRLCYEVLFLDTFSALPAPPRVTAPQRDRGPSGPAPTRPTPTRQPRPRRRT